MKKYLLSTLSFLVVTLASGQVNDSIATALKLVGLSFSEQKIDSLSSTVKERIANYQSIREHQISNDLPFSLVFFPPINDAILPKAQSPIQWNFDEKVNLPKNRSDLAFYPVYRLSSLIKQRKISSVELTQFFLERLHRYGDTLACVITITDSLALAQARKADEEIRNGIYRGPLHGIPYGAKDLLSVAGYKTTWGAMPYKDQVIEETATTIQKLEKAGAVLVAKLTLGALAWGDVWYGGTTRNPWNLEEGSSGSSAGSASATVAGLVPFALGTETWGSIVSPSTQCGATGLRPTFGRVSRHGAMALSWSMDKIGPICRNAIDCALVLDVIRGVDGLDLSVREFPFNYNYSKSIKNLRVGILQDEFDKKGFNYKNDSTLIALLRTKNILLVDKKLPTGVPANAISFILQAEAATAFDELTRSGKDSLMVRQIKNAWPNVFRAARLIPAVEYIQANRLRYRLTQEFNAMMQDIDVLIAPSFSGQLLITNLTGHPCVVLPDGSYADNEPGSITLLGNHFDEASILQFARYLQELTPFDQEVPPLFQE